MAAARRPYGWDEVWDAIVCGGGMAGQVVAGELAGPRGPLERVLVIDDGSHPVGRRTWAFWAARRTAVDDAVTGRWQRLAVHAGGRELSLDPAPYDYRLVDGAALARLTATRVAAARHTLVQRTGAVEEVVDRGDHAVAVVDGQPLAAAWVFDSRPPAPPRPGEPRMRFVGRVTDADGDIFDRATATFLDFRVAQDPNGDGVRFAYVLPFESSRALVDIVTWTTGAGDPDERDAVPGYLSRVLGVPGRTVHDHEAGEIALRQEPPPPPTGRVVAVGRRGGALKPSTGFAVDRILRHGEAIAHSLRHHGHPHGQPHARRGSAPRHRWLDQVLLDVLAHEPARIEEAFAALFARNPPALVLRFLDEDTTRAEESRLVATLPPWPFLRAARRLAGRRRPPLPGTLRRPGAHDAA